MDLENFCNCRSDLENLGGRQLVIRALLAEGVLELSNAGGIRGGGVTSLLSPRKTGGVFRGARHVKSVAYRYRGSTRHVVDT